MRALLSILLLPAVAGAQAVYAPGLDWRPMSADWSTGAESGAPALWLPLNANGPLLPEDAGTVSHVYWNGSALVDSKGNAWTMNGTVPQVAANASPFVPGKAGAGPYSAANNYQGPITLMEFSGTQDWSLTIVAHVSSIGSTQMLAQKGGANAGWGCYLTAAGLPTAFHWDGANKIATSATGVVIGAVNVITCGRSGSTLYVRVNSASSFTQPAVGTVVAASATAPRIGADSSSANAATGVGVYEVIASTTPYSDALHAARFAAVWGQSALSVTRALDTQTYVANGSTWLAPAGALATESAGASIWKASTNYALQSSTLSSGTAAVAPWALSTATVATTAGGAPDGSNWAEVTSSTNTGAIYQATTTASSATFSGGAMVVRASGSAIATVTVRCGGVPSACTCYPSGTCTASTGGASPNDCNAKATVAQTAVDLGVNVTCPAAITNPVLVLYPGEALVSTGTARFSMAHVELGAYPTPYIPTAAAAATRNATVATVPLPSLGNKWCVAITYQPGQNWSDTSTRYLWSTYVGVGANAMNLSRSGGNVAFNVFDSAGGTRTVTWAHGLTGTASKRLVACNNSGVLSMCADGVSVGSLSGAGTALQTATLTPLYVGSQNGSSPVDGSESYLKICKGATKCSDCR